MYCSLNFVAVTLLWLCRATIGRTASSVPRQWSLLHSSRHSYPHFEASLSRQRLTNRFGGSLLNNCSVYWFEQHLDHFNWRPANDGRYTYLQRYFICGGSKWAPNDANKPIFYYTGNEANVELYINNTGLMWENADDFSALMIFAEHRYFGESLPFGSNDNDMLDENIVFLNADQALADFATLLSHLLAQWAHADNGLTSVTPVIGFGGSYGGMLCTWFRTKYPHLMDGCIAGSAPTLAFEGLQPPLNPDFFAEIETYDCKATGGGGVTDACAKNYANTWDVIFDWAKTSQGRNDLTNAFRLCSVPKTEAKARSIADWVSNAVASMSMSSFPYASSYLLNGNGVLPPYPIRLGCVRHLNEAIASDWQRLEAVRDAVGIYYNYSHALDCFDMDMNGNEETTVVNTLWNYLYCTEIFMPFGQVPGENDMFWNSPWDPSEVAAYCREEYKNPGPRQLWAANNFGGFNAMKEGVSNIVFSNGELDPWRGGGVTDYVDTRNGIYSVVVSEAGHHLDLMFSHPNDHLTNVETVRAFEMARIKEWIEQKKSGK